MTIYRAFEVKEGKTYRETYRTEDRVQVYEDLAHELLSHKVFHSNYYTKMEQHNNYDGTRTIMFYQKHGSTTGRSVYRVHE